MARGWNPETTAADENPRLSHELPKPFGESILIPPVNELVAGGGLGLKVWAAGSDNVR